MGHIAHLTNPIYCIFKLYCKTPDTQRSINWQSFLISYASFAQEIHRKNWKASVQVRKITKKNLTSLSKQTRGQITKSFIFSLKIINLIFFMLLYEAWRISNYTYQCMLLPLHTKNWKFISINFELILSVDFLWVCPAMVMILEFIIFF